MKERILIICVACMLDLLLGDPHWLWHPVCGIGKVIEWTERGLRRLFGIRPERDADIRKKKLAGILLAALVLFAVLAITGGLLALAEVLHPLCRSLVECVICYQMLAMRSLKVESMKVYDALQRKDVEAARQAVSMIVGRDTECLTAEGITKAAVETVAENTSDGVVAPLLYLFVFGVYGIVAYKAVNTMDSMVGYRNDRYLYLGRAAARLDDVCNFIPARISALCMMGAAFLLGLDGKRAVFIFRRDRYRHSSPNSAQTEAVCAGALGVQLAGDAWYFGVLHRKPTIGDAIRKVEAEDIVRANRLLYGTSGIVFVVGILALVILGL
ncbi:MAG: adenosylcobinamide-phosphate synthase CbiB [Roseburia sp.]|nr:adenosylcobinamide-phosphate synthase CbiB [Roseburia sp.]